MNDLAHLALLVLDRALLRQGLLDLGHLDVLGDLVQLVGLDQGLAIGCPPYSARPAAGAASLRGTALWRRPARSGLLARRAIRQPGAAERRPDEPLSAASSKIRSISAKRSTLSPSSGPLAVTTRRTSSRAPLAFSPMPARSAGRASIGGRLVQHQHVELLAEHLLERGEAQIGGVLLAKPLQHVEAALVDQAARAGAHRAWRARPPRAGRPPRGAPRSSARLAVDLPQVVRVLARHRARRRVRGAQPHHRLQQRVAVDGEEGLLHEPVAEVAIAVQERDDPLRDTFCCAWASGLPGSAGARLARTHSAAWATGRISGFSSLNIENCRRSGWQRLRRSACSSLTEARIQGCMKVR